MKTFKEWLIEEGLWLNDANAQQTSGGVRATRKSKDAAPSSGGVGANPSMMPPQAAGMPTKNMPI